MALCSSDRLSMYIVAVVGEGIQGRTWKVRGLAKVSKGHQLIQTWVLRLPAQTLCHITLLCTCRNLWLNWTPVEVKCIFERLTPSPRLLWALEPDIGSAVSGTYPGRESNLAPLS